MPASLDALLPEVDEVVNDALDGECLMTPCPMDKVEGGVLDEGVEGGVLDDEGKAQKDYVQKENDKKVLLAMAVGLVDKDDGGAPFIYWNAEGGSPSAPAWPSPTPSPGPRSPKSSPPTTTLSKSRSAAAR